MKEPNISNSSFYLSPNTYNGITTIDVNQIIHTLQYRYSLVMFIISSLFLFYVLWNNFVRSPSRGYGAKHIVDKYISKERFVFLDDEGAEPSLLVKRVSRTIDSCLVFPALIMFYITFTYLFG